MGHRKGIILAGGSGKPLGRGEVEITTLLEMYLADGSLTVQRMGRG